METALIKILKALSDETRLRILHLLYHSDLCVCELEALLGISQSNASRHLNKLANAGLLRYYRDKKYIYYQFYSAQAEEYPFIQQVLKTEAGKVESFQRDYHRLAKYREMGYTCDDLKAGRICFKTEVTTDRELID